MYYHVSRMVPIKQPLLLIGKLPQDPRPESRSFLVMGMPEPSVDMGMLIVLNSPSPPPPPPSERVAHVMAAVDFLSRCLNGPLP